MVENTATAATQEMRTAAPLLIDKKNYPMDTREGRDQYRRDLAQSKRDRAQVNSENAVLAFRNGIEKAIGAAASLPERTSARLIEASNWVDGKVTDAKENAIERYNALEDNIDGRLNRFFGRLEAAWQNRKAAGSERAAKRAEQVQADTVAALNKLRAQEAEAQANLDKKIQALLREKAQVQASYAEKAAPILDRGLEAVNAQNEALQTAENFRKEAAERRQNSTIIGKLRAGLFG